MSQPGFDPSFGNLTCLSTPMSSDRTKQICLWMTIYIYMEKGKRKVERDRRAERELEREKKKERREILEKLYGMYIKSKLFSRLK